MEHGKRNQAQLTVSNAGNGKLVFEPPSEINVSLAPLGKFKVSDITLDQVVWHSMQN